MANIDNIDRDALREAFTRYAHNEIDSATKRHSKNAFTIGQSGMFSRGGSVLELDPLVKYRFAGREAIDDLEFSQAVNGNPERTWSGSRYTTPFFTQGVPYWAIGEMVARGDGTSQGIEPSNPFLIGTYGDNWLTDPSGENLELSTGDIDKKAIKYLAKERGITPEKIEIIEDFQRQYKELGLKIRKIDQSIEERDINHRKSLSRTALTPQDFLERTVRIPEIDDLIKQHKELTKKIHQFGPEISTHILGDKSKGVLSWAEQFARTQPNLVTQGNVDYLSSARTIEDVFPSKIQEFKRPLTERLKFSKEFLRRYPDMAITPVWGDFSPDLQKLHKLKNSIGVNDYGLETVRQTTDLVPQEFGLIPNSDGSFSAPSTVKTGLKNKDPIYLDVSSDESLFEKIKAGLASPSEISRAFGLGALAPNGNMLGNERLDDLAFPNDNIETVPSIVIPKIGKQQPFKIPASSVQLANRPFAVWEWDNGKFNLVNEGNNKSIGGSKPIPTGNVPKVTSYQNLDGRTVQDLFDKNKRRGFVAIPKFLEKGVGNLVLDAQINAANADAFRTQYVNNKGFRNMTNKYLGGQVPKVAAGALAGLHLKSKIDEGMPIAQAVPVTAAEIGIGVAKFKLFDRFFGGVTEISPISDTSTAAHREFIAARKAADVRREAETKAKLSSYENSPVSDWPSHNPATWMLNGQ